MTEEVKPKKPRARKPASRTLTQVRATQDGPARNWSDIIIRLAMIGVSAGSVAQMLGYPDLGHALMAIGGACGANVHLKGGN